LAADLSFAFEILLIKNLAALGVEGDIVGLFYGFFVGNIGILGLIVYSLSGAMANETFSMGDYLIIVFGGCVECVG
jgi:hypothetical protein